MNNHSPIEPVRPVEFHIRPAEYHELTINDKTSLYPYYLPSFYSRIQDPPQADVDCDPRKYYERYLHPTADTIEKVTTVYEFESVIPGWPAMSVNNIFVLTLALGVLYVIYKNYRKK